MQSGRRVLAASVLASLAVGGVASAAGASAAGHAHPSSAHRTAAQEGDVNASLAATGDALGDEVVFWKGQDGNLWYAIWSASSAAWGSATSLGMGPLGSEPSVTLGPVISGTAGTAGADQEFYVYWQGADNNLWTVQGAIDGEGDALGSSGLHVAVTATSPTSLGMGPLGSKPAATYVTAGGLATGSGTSNVLVFWKGTDGNLWDVNLPVTTATGVYGTLPTSPSVISGMATLGSEPTVGSDSSGDVFVYWQGAGNNTHVWEAWYNASATPTPTWSGPLDLGQFAYGGGSGNTGSAPQAAVSPTGQQVVFWQGQDGNLYYETWNGATAQPNTGIWVGYTEVPGMGPLNSKPAVAWTPNGSGSQTLQVFWKGTDLNIWTCKTTVTAGTVPTTSSTWTGPTSIGDGPIDGV